MRNDDRRKHLIVMGAAPCRLADMAAVPRVCSYDCMAIGMDAIDKGPWPIRYVATYHPEDIPDIYRRRAAIGANADFELICHERRDRVDIHIPDYWRPSGSSALLGIQAALLLGYERIVVCGCPLTGKNGSGANYEQFRKGWEARASQLSGRVRSMSGWTREFLGAPNEEWLLAACQIAQTVPREAAP